MIYLDFETRSQADIWAVGAWNYSCHPTTEVLCICHAVDNGEVRLTTSNDLEDVELWEELYKPKDIFCAHNAFFEQAIWENILVKRYGWPRIPIKQWRCSAAKAAARSLPRSLENCAKALKTPHQKDMSGKRIMLKLAKSTGEMDENDLKSLYKYCAEDVLTERDIDKALPDLTEKEQVIWFHDQLINQRGVAVDKEAIDAAIKLAKEHTDKLNSEIVTLTEGVLDGVSRRTAVMNWIKRQGVDITNYDKKTIQELVKTALPNNVRTVLETRLELGKTSVKKYEAMQNAVDADGRIRDLLLYHGANTGRWSGKLVQIQNLPSSKGEKYDMDTLVGQIRTQDIESMQLYYGDVMKWLSLAVRGMFIAPEGKQLLVADYNAIEARVLFWLAGDEKGLTAYKENRDIYVDTAKVIYGCDIVSKAQRQLGKIAVLGSGYGMGAVKFRATCNNFGLVVDEVLAEKAIRSYRQIYNAVPRFWSAVEQSAIRTISTGQDTDCGRVRWSMDNGVLLCRLPSGRSIVYNGARVEDYKIKFMATNSTTHQWEEDSTYGGKLVENITQAVARDILAEALLRAERAGYPIVMHVHDEAVSESDKDLETFVKLLEVQPEWAKGLPLKVEGFKCRRYSK